MDPGPRVTLEAVDGMRWISDSAGVIAVREPGLIGERTWFHVRSAGYEVAADGFGNATLTVDAAHEKCIVYMLHALK